MNQEIIDALNRLLNEWTVIAKRAKSFADEYPKDDVVHIACEHSAMAYDTCAIDLMRVIAQFSTTNEDNETSFTKSNVDFDRFDIPDELILASTSFGDSMLIEYINPSLTESEMVAAKESWMDEANRVGGPEIRLRCSPLFGAGNLREPKPEQQ